MTEVQLNGLALSVTPIDQMADHRKATASVILARHQSAVERRDWEDVQDSLADLVRFAVDEDLTNETIRALDIDELEVLHRTILPSPGGDADV